MYLKPASPGLIVRDPSTRQPLPEEGREVQLNEWWARRLRAGDVVEAEPPAAPEPRRRSKSYEVKS